MTPFEIIPTQNSDLEFIYYLFEEAIAYQKKKKFPVWNGFDKSVIQQDIALTRQHKIVCMGEIAGIFSLLDSDELIWREKEIGNAVYLHRVVVNPAFKGQNQFQKILDWSMTKAKEKRRTLVRMDTWAENANIISYYQKFGFQVVEYFTTGCSTELPVQNRLLNLALLEKAVGA